MSDSFSPMTFLDHRSVSTDQSVVDVQLPELEPVAVFTDEGAHVPPTAENRETAQTLFLEAQQAGYHDGLQAARSEQSAVTALLLKMVEQTRLVTELQSQKLEEHAASLAYDLAVALLRSELSCNPSQVLGVVRGALDALSDAQQVHVELHPDDLAHIRTQIESAPQAGMRVLLHEDDTLTRGGCRVRSDVGDIDGTVEGRVEKLRAKIDRTITERQAGRSEHRNG